VSIAVLAATPPATGRTYRRRTPEDTLLYKAIEAHLPAFRTFARERNGHELPVYVSQAFERYLDCGRLDRAFSRVTCPSCRAEFVVGLSCKDRSLCPSCMQRRMVDLAAQSVDRLFPAHVPVRQWVATAPWELRLLLAKDPKVLSHFVRVMHDEVSRSYLARVRTEIEGERRTAAMTHIQRFSGSLSLSPHLHSLWPDGVYVLPPGGAPAVFVAVPPPSHTEIEHVAERIGDRMLRWLRRSGRIDARAVEERSNESRDDDPQTALLRAGAAQGTFARLLDARGQDGNLFARRDEEDAPFDAHARKPRSKWAASVKGFSLHAGTSVAAENRVGLEKLLRYCARPSLSLERLSRLPDGRFAYEMKHPIGSKTHRIMDALELMARLASIVAPPCYPLVRFAGLFAPGSRDRARVVPGRAPGPPRCCAEHAQPVPPPTAAATQALVASPCTPDPVIGRTEMRAPERNAHPPGILDTLPAAPSTQPASVTVSPLARIPGGTRTPWAMLMKHAFGVDLLSCRCGARMDVVAVVQDAIEVRRYLAHAGLEPRRRDTPTRAWDPMPFDDAFVEHAGCDPCLDDLPPDDWTA
jgi:hypothetical protein